jgi:lysophospholipase L1-like esterase
MQRGLRYWVKLVAGNALVLFVLLCGLNFLAALGYDARELIEERFVGVSEKAYRASLSDSPNAESIFREFARLQTRYVPYVEWKREPFRGETTNIGEDGDRVMPPTTTDPLAHARFFGGSTMWGKGVDDANTIPAKFNRLHPELAVRNHGESGYVSRQSLERLINIVAQSEPTDLVVFYDGCNDFYTLCRTDTSLNGHSRENELARKFRPPSMTVEALSGALREIIFWAWGRSLKTTGPGSRCQASAEGAESVARTTVNNWRIAKRVADEAGAEFHAILQPIAVVGKPHVDYLGYLRDSPAQRLGDYSAVYPHIQRMIREAGEPWMHDFTDTFDGGEAIFIDACHVNARGNDLMARRMDEAFGATWLERMRVRAKR